MTLRMRKPEKRVLVLVESGGKAAAKLYAPLAKLEVLD